MPWLFWGLLLALLAVALALLGRQVDGSVLILVPPYRIELSFFLSLVLAGALVLAAFWLAWLVQRLLAFPQRVASYRRRRDEAGGQYALREAVKSLFEGRFARAEKQARVARLAPENAGVAALVGARAAHRMRQGERRDAWLQEIEADPSLTMARLVSGAEMWAEARESERALRAIDQLQSAGTRHLHAARIALKANLQAGRWDEVLKGLRVLDKRGALHPVAVARYRRDAYLHLLGERRQDPQALQSFWNGIAAEQRREPDLALHGALVLNEAGCGRLAAEALESALQQQWDERLVDAYARIQGDPARPRIERAEAWLRERPRDPALLRCLGLLCQREQLWGKAEIYLQESLRLQIHPDTLLALARLAETLGNETEAHRYFREAALAYADRREAATADPGAAPVSGTEPDGEKAG
jgi:HemY protein